MQRLDTLTDSADQITTLILPDKSLATFEFIYRPAIQRWTFSVSHPTLTVNGLNLCLSPNLLRPWRNVIPFGLACTSSDGADVAFIHDFLSGRILVYGLSAAEVAAVETSFVGYSA